MSYNILIVDDSKLVKTVITKTLELAKVPVNELHYASNGKKGLVALREKQVDLVFCDIHMPEMTGEEMIEVMQEDTVLKSIPVIVVSTEGSKERIEHLKAKGVKDIIRKPFTPGSIRNAVLKEMESDNAG